MIRKLAIASFMLGLIAAPAAAQIQVDLIPYVGAYLPTNDLAVISYATSTDQTNKVTFGQRASVLLGGRVDVWLSPKWGVEGNFAYAFSQGEETSSVGGQTDDSCSEAGADCGAYVWYGSVKALYRIYPKPDAGYSVHLAAGPAFIGRGGAFYDGLEGSETSDIGGVLGVGVDVAVSSMMGLAIDFEDYIYKYKTDVDIEGTTYEASSKIQNDLAFTVGLVIHLGR
jgi:hypothetical protein